MGGLFSRKKTNPLDPNFPPNYYDPNFASMGPGGYGGPPPYPYGPNSGFGEYDPYDVYGYENPMTDTFQSLYGGRHGRGKDYF